MKDVADVTLTPRLGAPNYGNDNEQVFAIVCYHPPRR